MNYVCCDASVPTKSSLKQKLLRGIAIGLHSSKLITSLTLACWLINSPMSAVPHLVLETITELNQLPTPNKRWLS